MTNQELADLIFPNITKTPEDYELLYPKRELKEGAKVVRFAPSPTGFMHIGNMMSATINYCLAKSSGGVFFLRNEDTDQARSVEGAVEFIHHVLSYYGIYPDEYEFEGKTVGNYGPYIQSERIEIYHAFIKYLISIGRAYPCFLTSDELNEIREYQSKSKKRIGIYGRYAKFRDVSNDEKAERIKNGEKFTIRFRSEGDFNRKFIFEDLTKGKIEMPENDIDVPIMKSENLLPTYHFAHVVDDHLMKTTHVVRGDEWVPSFPKHLQLCKLLGFKPCKYAHIAPLTKKEDGKVRKLSKRKDPEFSVSYYKEAGIPVDAVRLYLATLANTNFEEWYLQNKDKSIEDFTFSFKKMPTGGTLFDMEKLNNISRTYFSRLTALELYNQVLEYSLEYDSDFAKLLTTYKDKVIAFLNIERDGKRPRKDIAVLKDVKTESSYLYNEIFYNDLKASYNEVIEETVDYDILTKYIDVYNSSDSQDEWYQKIQKLAEENNYAPSVKMYREDETLYKGHIGSVCEMIRHVLTGRNKTPNLYDLLRIIGIDEFKNRLEAYENNLH